MECTESFLCISCGEGGAAVEGDMLKPGRTTWRLVAIKSCLVSLLRMYGAAQPTRPVTNVTCHTSQGPNVRRRSDPVHFGAQFPGNKMYKLDTVNAVHRL